MKVGVISLGCVKNRVDTEQMLSLLVQAGYAVTNDPAKAQVLIVNTCGFIDPAKEESIDTVLEMAQYKSTGVCKVLCVTGCLAQRYAEDLLQNIPEIDCLLGVSQYHNIVSMIEQAMAGKHPKALSRAQTLLECGRVLTTPHYSAYVRLADGCDNRCAYCAIPLIRGGFRSRRREDILQEMRLLAQNGAREQILIAQDTTRYGIDTGDTLRGLIKEAAQIEGVDWLRVLYMYPDETDVELLKEMARHENVVRYLDLPLQHASQGLLKSMNRRGTMESTRKLLHTAREMGFCLRTTFIVGFPGETEADFEALMDFVREIRFDHMGAFTFSKEEDTPAFLMEPQVPKEVAQERLDRLMALQAEISKQRNALRVGKVEKVLITGHDGLTYVGRSAFEAPDADGEIAVLCDHALEEGAFVNVLITGADAYDLTGEVSE